jgi:hypothetical protein
MEVFSRIIDDRFTSEEIEIGNLRHYATSRKATGSIPEEVFFSVCLVLPAALEPWIRLSS